MGPARRVGRDKVIPEVGLGDVVAHGNKPRTHESYREMVRLHIFPATGHIQLAKLSPEHVRAMLSELFTKKLALRTVGYAWAILRRSLNQALRWNIVPPNAALLVEAPRTERKERVVLDLAQSRRLLAGVKGHRHEQL